MKQIHIYNNGIKCYRNTIYGGALSRYEKYINLHEPFEDTIFDHIIKNNDVKTFIDVGAAWGYYSIYAKKLNKNINVIGFDADEEMIKNAYENAELNDITDIEFRKGGIPENIKLIDVVSELKQIDLIKIDIQGEGASALESAGSEIVKIKNLIMGTHGKEHNDCSELLSKYGFKIKMSATSSEIPIQPDGLLWATL